MSGPVASVICDRTVNIHSQARRRYESRWFRSFFSDSDHWPRITFAQLYETLAHGEPGDYLLLDES